MAAIPHITVQNGGLPSLGQNQSAYQPLGSGATLRNASGDVGSRVRWGSSGVLSLLFIAVLTNTRTTASTVTSRINGADGSQAVSVTAATTGHFEDASHTDSISAGNDVNCRVTAGNGGVGTVFTYNAVGCLFAATVNTVTRLVHVDGTGWIASETFPLGGDGRAPDASTAEDDVRSVFRTAGTLKNAAVRVSANTRNGAVTQAVIADGVATSIAVSVTAATTGVFEDLSNTETIASGARVNWRPTIGGSSGSITGDWLALDLETTNGQAMFFGDTFTTFSTVTTKYLPVAGGGTAAATEASASSRLQATGPVSRLRVRVSQNTSVGTLTATLRINNADATNSVTVPAGQSGDFEDTSHVDTIAASDVVDIKVVTTGGSGAITLVHTGLLWGELEDRIGCAVFGVNTTVAATRAVAFGLDGETNVHDTPGTLKIFGDLVVTGDTTVGGSTSTSFTLTAELVESIIGAVVVADEEIVFADGEIVTAV